MVVERANPPRISVVITAHNEGDELRQTIDSIRRNASSAYEIILVDDGSTDGCCDPYVFDSGVQLVRHDARVGIALSRHEASLMACGDVIAYMDGHQRVEGDSLEQSAESAMAEGAIVCPDICGLQNDSELMHGAYFVLCGTNGFYSAEWKRRTPRGGIGQISSLKAPAYFIPKTIYPLVQWSRELRGWGGSEAAVSLKAFFTGVKILHVCGPLIRHRFKEKFHYEVGWPEVWRNQAIIARVCFEEPTWYDYWLPQVFQPHLSDTMQKSLESDAIKAEQRAFSKIKVREDKDFWTRLVFRNVPEALRSI